MPVYPYAAGSGYDVTMLFAKALEQSKKPLDTSTTKQYFDNLKNYHGVIGTFSFDENGDVGGIGFTIKHVENGKFVDQSIANTN
jgi:ABC-type branched-subunit amino acid transport system substrate-binding protein